jgi:hypothetical protein
MFSLALVGGLLSLFVFLVAGGIAIMATVFWIWMLVDCAMKEPSQGNDKIVWILVILFTHLIGAALYFFIRRPKRIAETGC